VSGNSTAKGPTIVYVSTRNSNSFVHALVDSNSDGIAETKIDFIGPLDTPNGIAWRQGSLYVSGFARENGVSFGYIRRYDNVDVYARARQKFSGNWTYITKDLSPETHHGWRYMTFGPDDRLYVAIGVPCNICPVDSFKGVPYASIVRMRPNGSQVETYATGIRNTVGLTFHPTSKHLFFTINGRDSAGDDLPDDGLYYAPKAGHFFGFPYCHPEGLGDPYNRTKGSGRPWPDPQYNAANKVLNCSAPSTWSRPLQALGPHVAPLGLTFLTSRGGTVLPASLLNTVLVAEHGSWNRARKIGYRLSLVKLSGASSSSGKVTSMSRQDFATGWLDAARNNAWGRPVDVTQLPDGSILVSDDGANCVYRITYRRPSNVTG